MTLYINEIVVKFGQSKLNLLEVIIIIIVLCFDVHNREESWPS